MRLQPKLNKVCGSIPHLLVLRTQQQIKAKVLTPLATGSISNVQGKVYICHLITKNQDLIFCNVFMLCLWNGTLNFAYN